MSQTDSVSISTPLTEQAASAVAACLRWEHSAAPVMAHLDALLAWLIHPGSPSSRPLDDAILATGLAPEQAVERAYRLLDWLLLGEHAQAPEETLGLKGETDPGVIKQRYRRLISVYHPDRHPARAADLTQRTERINRAYRLLMLRHAAADSEWTGGAARVRSPQPLVRTSPVLPAWRSPAGDVGKPPPRGLHARPLAGAPARWDASLIQRRLIQAMVLGSAALLAILLLEQDPADEADGMPSAVVVQPIASTAAQPEELPPLPIGPPLATGKPPSSSVEPPAELLSPASVPPREGVVALEVGSGSGSEAKVEAGTLSEPLRAPPVAETNALGATGAASPGVPTIVKAAPPPKALQAPASVGTDACAGVSEALRRFRQAYQAGVADRLANLFALDGRERETSGRASIRRLYADWFASTSERNISFAGVSAQTVGKDQCRIRVRFDAVYRDANGRARGVAGQMTALFISDGGRTLIQTLNY